MQFARWQQGLALAIFSASMRILLVVKSPREPWSGGAGALGAALVDALSTKHDILTHAQGEGRSGGTGLALAIAGRVAISRPELVVVLGSQVPVRGAPTIRVLPPGPPAAGGLRSALRGVVVSPGTHGPWAAWGLPTLPHLVRDEAPPRGHEPPERLRVLIAGALSAGHGQHIAVEAIRGLPDHDRAGLDVRVQGPTGDADAASMLARRMSGSGAELLPPAAKAHEPLAWADVVLLASPAPAGWGRMAVEAMAAGCVVVHGRCPVLDEAVGPAGIAVPSGDVKALGVALRTLGRDRSRVEALRAAALRRAEAWRGPLALAAWEHALLEFATR